MATATPADATPLPGINDPVFWDAAALDREFERVFDICHGCRMCFNYCGSFPALFDAVDRHDDAGEGEVAALTHDEKWEVVDRCYQCKLCYVKCPYTRDDGHRFNLDFPRLMLRARLHKARDKGIPLSTRLTANPDSLGKFGTALAPLSNFGLRLKITRWFMHHLMGMHKHFNLPAFGRTAFDTAFRRRYGKGIAPKAPTRHVAIFASCTVMWQKPELGLALAGILERSGCAVILPAQKCCGMPMLDAGDHKKASRHGCFNLESFRPYVDQGYDVVIPGPTCSLMFKREYEELLELQGAPAVAERCYDAAEYLIRLHADGELATDGLKPMDAAIAYHLACHLRAQQTTTAGLKLLGLIPKLQVTEVQTCSGVDGTWGMRTAHFQESQKIAAKLYERIESAGAQAVAGDCLLANQNSAYGTKRSTYHPVELYWHSLNGTGPCAPPADAPAKATAGASTDASASSDAPASS